MLIYLYGPDSYRRQNKLKEIVASYKNKHSSLSVELFYLEQDGEFDRLKNYTVSQSLFDQSKLAIIHGLSADLKGAPKFLKSVLENKNTTLIVASEKALGADFKFLKEKPVLSQEFEKLEGAQLLNFIKKEAEGRGAKITADDIIALTRANNGNTWGIINDLEKITLGGKAEYVEEAPDFWFLLGALKGATPAQKKLANLTRLLEVEEASMIFNVLASQAAGELKNKMADLDPLIKTGKLGYEEALTQVAISN